MGVVAGRVRLLSEGGRDRTARFPALAQEAAALPDCRLEGEMAALDEHGRSDFAALLSALSSRRTSGLVLLASDLLALAGEDLRHLPRSSRRLRLESLLERCDGPAFDHLCIVETHAQRLARTSRRALPWFPVDGNANAA
jgi:bifunctional non-homologous end joining protein LigD